MRFRKGHLFDFMCGKTKVYCETRELAKEFLNFLGKFGIRWRTGDKASDFFAYGRDTTFYYINDESLFWGDDTITTTTQTVTSLYFKGFKKQQIES